MIYGGSSLGSRISDFGFYFLIVTGLITGGIFFYAMKVCMEEAENSGKTEEERQAAKQKTQRVYIP
jgi:hypothetical protein